jgi:hypothetical protein
VIIKSERKPGGPLGMRVVFYGNLVFRDTCAKFC